MSQKSELLRMAADLEEAAKNEEVCFIVFHGPDGRMKRVHRYDLPHVADGLRLQAQFLTE